jgi:hypothetical protein
MTTVQNIFRWHRPLMVFAAAMAALALVSAAGLLLDDRVLIGAPIWLKPLKFSISFVIYAVTMAWMLTLLSRGRRVANWAGTAVAVTGAIEMVIIVGQVIRGRRSHFNAATEFDERLFNVMGATIIILWSATLIIAVLLLRAPIADRANAWAIRLGILLALVGMGLGVLMTQPTQDQRAEQAADTATVVGSHSVGVPEGGPGLPLTNWSTTGGDLRIPHFIGLHALQALPLLSLLLAGLARRGTGRARRLDEVRRLRLVLLAAALYAGMIALLTWQALRGQPLLRPDGATLAAAGGLLAVAVAGALIALRRPTAVGPVTRPVERQLTSIR